MMKSIAKLVFAGALLMSLGLTHPCRVNAGVNININSIISLTIENRFYLFWGPTWCNQIGIGVLFKEPPYSNF